jgi:hypothetical protein
MLDILRTASQVPEWHSAISDFHRSLAEVQSLSAERRAVSAHVNSLLRHRNAREAAAAALRENAAERVRAEARRPALAAANDTAARRQVQANATASAYKDTRPGLFASRASKRRWNEGREEHAQEVRQAAADAVTARESLATLDREIAAARRAERKASDALGQADMVVRSAERAIKDARLRWGDRMPDGPEYGETERHELIEQRELSAPWADEEVSRARTRLFLAALALHKAFILNAGPRIFQNLNALMSILDGKGRPKDAAATLPVSRGACRVDHVRFRRQDVHRPRPGVTWLAAGRRGRPGRAAERGRRAVAVPARGDRRRPAAAGAGRDPAVGRTAGAA